MKYVVALLCVVVGMVSALTLTTREEEDLSDVVTRKCNSDSATAMDYEELGQWYLTEGTEDDFPATAAKHFLCVYKAVGWISSDGKVSKAVMKGFNSTVAEAKKLVNECGQDQENELKTARHIFYCILKIAKYKNPTALPPTEKECEAKIAAADKKCDSDPTTTLDIDVTISWIMKKGKEPVNFKSGAHCLLKALGYIDADGKLSKDSLEDCFIDVVPDDEFENMFNTCGQDQENEIDTAAHFLKCYLTFGKENIKSD